jgi:hypothetical protein
MAEGLRPPMTPLSAAAIVRRTDDVLHKPVISCVPDNSNAELYSGQPIGAIVSEVGYSARAPGLVLRLGNLE